MTILDKDGFFNSDIVGKWHGSKTVSEVTDRVERCNDGAAKLIESAWSLVSPPLPDFRLKYSISAPRDILTPYERAQSLCFITKYDALPEPQALHVERFEDVFVPTNLSSFRHVLNEYRPIVQNKKDSTHFSKIHRLCKSKLANRDHSIDLSVTAYDAKTDNDITELFLTNLSQRNKAISQLLSSCDFGYLYNGILQHAEHTFTKRYIEDYTSGRLHYLIFGHAMVCHTVRDLLYIHYVVLKAISGVRQGGL